MKILSLILVGYRRFALNSVNTFTIIPSEQIQLVLGTNGSGKSSLIKELTPLPADSSDYSKEGSKTIKLTNRGNSYLLKSIFMPSAKHSFIKNDEELNPGGTSTVQKELVKKEFNITPQIHNLLIGIEKFHSMSPSRRREWFTILSDISYDYALLVYGKLKERNRDLSGALKLAKKRLITESSKSISLVEEKKLQDDLDQTHKELNILIEQSSPLDKPIADYESSQKLILDELGRLSTKLLRMRFVAPYGVHPKQTMERDEWYGLSKRGFSCIADIDVLINNFNIDIAVKESLINKMVLDHTEISRVIAILIKTGELGVKDLQNKLETLRSIKAGVLNNRKLKIEGIDPINSLNALDSIYDTLSSVFSVIPENEDKRFSQTRLNEITQSLINAKDLKNRKLEKLTHLNNKKIHMDAHKTNGDTICPKCMHSWVVGYDSKAHETVISSINLTEEEIILINKTITNIEFEIVSINEYSDFYKDFIRCVKNWPILKPFWDYLLDGNYVTRSPRKALSILETFRFDLEIELEANRVEADIVNMLDMIKSAEQTGDVSLSNLRIKLDENTLAISESTFNLTQLKISCSEYSHYKRQLVEAEELCLKISELMKSGEKVNTDMIEMVRRDILNHCVRQLQHSLALKQTAISTITLQKAIVSDLEEQIVKLTIEEEASRMLVKQLSPTDGLIADGLMGFINSYTGSMNNLIRKIWAYPLQITSCGLTGANGAELDYKFPLLVQTKDNVVPDVKFGSSGMQVIIDLAFRVIAMRYLNLAESPLYLDEISAQLDSEHRTSATTTIKSLMETQPFTQLFMIDHYQSNYGSFTNAQVCVMDSRNITVPSVYNKHVIFN